MNLDKNARIRYQYTYVSLNSLQMTVYDEYGIFNDFAALL